MEEPRHLYVRRASAGSGKTFTLAAHYIALLLHGESYRSILAVTFTNKATAEMKERILTYLYSIARETDLKSTQGFLARVRDIYKELGFTSPDISSDAFCRRRAEELFGQILSDYDSMRVQTIDAFLQSLLSGMVQMLGGAVGYQVELDTEGVIDEAVDRLLTIEAQDEAVRRRITRYMNEQMAQDKSWDIRAGLREIARELYREQLQQHTDRLVLDEVEIEDFKKRMQWQKHCPLEELKAVLPMVKESDARKRIEASITGEMKKKDDIFRGFTDIQAGKLAADSPEMRMHLLAADCRKAWFRWEQTTRHLNDLVLMNELRNLIQTALNEANTRLLGVTAATLAKTLHGGDADFILEKVGIRYRHIMLDEFQDTSSLQWENFRLLLEELLSSAEGSTLIVGDIKQSIYRWRNGDWTIMARLDKDWEAYYNRDVPALQRNFRSEKEVVRFNLETMRRLTAGEDNSITDLYNEEYDGTNLATYYRAGHENGYVRLRCVKTPNRGEERRRARQENLQDMFEAIGRLHESGVPYSDMMILVRKNKEATEIVETMAALGLNLPIVSGDCFLLENSLSVQTLIAAMRYLYRHDEVSAEFLRLVRPDLDPKALVTPDLQAYSLTDLTERLTRIWLCDAEGRFTGTDLAYLMSFKDKLRSHVTTAGSDGPRFLDYWDEKLHGKSVPSAESDGIRMMTIHASKGLEARNLFIPFCDWRMEEDKQGNRLWCEVEELHTKDGHPAILPIPQGKAMSDAGFEREYTQEHYLQRIDNLNLLYVALTRAAERLYVWSDVGESDSVGASLMALYGEEYTAGEEFWSVAAKEEEKRATQPFRFSGSPAEAATCHSSEEHIEFQQSQDSRKYGWNIATLSLDSNPVDARAFGTICHDTLALLGTYPDREAAMAAVPGAVDDAYRHGLIPDRDTAEAVLPLVLATVSDPTVGEWFTGDWQVLREEALIFADEHGEIEERRMDRVMWRGDEAIVLDYKFGHDDPKYDRQVRHYMNICRRMGAKRVSGYLWIAQTQTLVEVK